MSRTIMSGDICLVKRKNFCSWSNFGLFSTDFQRGDIVFFKKKSNIYTKRIIGLSGDSIEIINGKAIVNGKPEQKLNKAILKYKIYPSTKNTFGTESEIDIIPQSWEHLDRIKTLGYRFESLYNSKNIDVEYFQATKKYKGSRDNIEKFLVPSSDTTHNNYFFLLGDNRMNSIDSRFFGFINEKDIVGKNCFCL